MAGDSSHRGASRGRVQGCAPPPTPLDDLRFSNTTGVLQKKKKTMWFIKFQTSISILSSSP